MRARLATHADDEILRKTLRNNAMPSWVTMSIEREPLFFNDESALLNEQAIVVEDSDQNLVGMYTCTQYPILVSGQKTDTGYLSSFRVNRAYRGKFRYIKAGYASIPDLAPSPSGYWFTCIANENKPARRLLEAGVRGLPVYKAIGDIVTIAIPRSRSHKHGLWRPVQEAEIPQLCAFYNSGISGSALAHRLTEKIVRRNMGSFYVHSEDSIIKSCMAVIDQRRHKQCVAKAYKFPLNALLPLYNLYARLFKKVELPRVGDSLQQVFIGYFMCQDGTVVQLLEDALSLIPTEVCAITLDARDCKLGTIRKHFSPAEYAAKVYLVGFNELPDVGGGNIHVNGDLL